MASISTDSKGNQRIIFTHPSGERRTIYVGKMPKRKVQTARIRVEHIVASLLTGDPLDDETSRWIASRNKTMTDKLVNVGLIAKREVQPLGEFVESYIGSRADIKPLTRRHLAEAAKKLKSFFGDDKALSAINYEDAEEFRRHLQSTLGENTVRRMCGRARQFFAVAMRKKMITENPFSLMKGLAVRPNPSKMFFVTSEMTQKLIDAAPDAQWRLIIALTRFGGLRNPSETLALRWDDVLWSESKIRVRSPKTEHHIGGESRFIPIFPELRPYLDEAWELLGDEPAEHVITRYRSAEQNLRTTFLKIIDRAGLKPWPRLFQNLRSSRETELAESFPMHLVCSWIGNSQPVAMKHYMQIRDEDFTRAATQKTTRNPTQQVSVATRDDAQPFSRPARETPVFQGSANIREPSRSIQMPSQGLEP